METTTKKWYQSKTLWVNIIAVLAIIIQGVTNNEIIVDTDIQGAILGLVNIILRLVTKVPII